MEVTIEDLALPAGRPSRRRPADHRPSGNPERRGRERYRASTGRFQSALRRGEADGVRAEVEDEVVYLDVYVVIRQGLNAREVSREVQQQVSQGDLRNAWHAGGACQYPYRRH